MDELRTEINKCDSLDYGDDRDICYNDFSRIIDDWQIQDDFGVCEKYRTNYSRNRCYGHRAIALSNINLCDKIFDEKEKIICTAALTRDVKRCDFVDNKFDREYCINGVAAELNDSNLCPQGDSISYGGCLLRIAARQKDSTICKKIEEPLIKSACESDSKKRVFLTVSYSLR